MRRIFAGVVAAVIGLAGCSKSPAAPTNLTSIHIAFDLSAVDAAAILSIDGDMYGTVATNTPITLQIPANAQSFSYKITNSPIGVIQDVQPDIIAATATAAVTPSATYTINNVIGTTTYFAPVIANNLGAPAYVGIYRSGALTCLAPLVTAEAGKDFGYWRLTSDTELRAYQSLSCTGPYHTWNAAQLSAYNTNTGVISLSLTSIP